MLEKQAFTMAEILLSLTIIGVIAAITLPSLTGNINERTWNTQRKALYARFSQAIALMPALNGYGTLDDTSDTAAETFITAGLAKVLKINNICDTDHLTDCGIPTKITTIDGTMIDDFTVTHNTLATYNSMFNGEYSHSGYENSDAVYSYHQTDTKAAAFETANGESILVYYNPRCKNINENSNWAYTQPKICANFLYDLNGTKGPNTVGKDIGFITAINPTDSIVVAPMPLNMRATPVATMHEAIGTCKNQNTESRLPNRDEAIAMFTNSLLLTGISGHHIWDDIVITSSKNSAGKIWTVSLGSGHQVIEGTHSVHCIKR